MQLNEEKLREIKFHEHKSKNRRVPEQPPSPIQTREISHTRTQTYTQRERVRENQFTAVIFCFTSMHKVMNYQTAQYVSEHTSGMYCKERFSSSN